MDYDATDAPAFYSQSFKTTYHFDTVAAVVAEDPTDPESVTSRAVMEDGDLVAQEATTHVIGDVVMWESGGNNGPSSTAKRLARVLTPLGDGAVVDEKNIHGWLPQSGVEMRSELVGQKVVYSIITRPGNEYDFNYPTLMTYPGGEFLGKVGEGAGAPVVNTDGAPAPAAAPSAPAQNGQTDGGVATETVPEFDSPNIVDDETVEDALPEPVESFITAMVFFADSDDADILTEMYATADDDANGLTHEMIEQVGEEEILQAIRQAKSN
jgi:hypothetical protein